MKNQIQIFSVVLLAMLFVPGAQAAVSCGNTITANVVVLDNPTVFNRLGAQNPNWITYALRRDVVVQPNVGAAVNVPVITAGADLVANTTATVDDVQVVPVGGTVAAAGDVVIDPGPNGVIDTTPATGDAAGIVAIPADTVLSQVPDGQLGAFAGQVVMRADKRTRPLVVRSVAGSCLDVNFTNLLAPVANPNDVQQGPPQGQPGALFNDDQVAGRCAGFHASGTEVVDNIADDGSMVGANDGANLGDSTNGPAAAVCGPGLAEPGGTRIYNLHTPHEGAFVINSYGAVLGSEQSSGNLGIGMFGQLNVQPVGASMYRSIVTEEEMRLATVVATVDGTGTLTCPGSGVAGLDGLCRTPLGQPIIDYEATYPNAAPWSLEGKGGLPVLNMLHNGELVHSDINAIIVGDGPNGTFDPSTYPLENVGKNVPSLPNRLEPFREFTSTFHDEQTNSQVFPLWYQNPVLNYTLAGVKDQFMINYGSGGIGSEIIANRLHTGPMHDCTDCAYEEFFLASQTVGDPGQLVNFPANTGIEQCDPTNILDAACWRQFADANPADPNDPANVNNGLPIGANPPIPGNFALFQEDPSNVHHSYTGDFVKIRNTHVGAFEQHIFHLHNHQWLFNPNDDNANYLDAQEIMPGSGHTYELVNGGAGNRNKTAGDAIFHCHFYPHFAQGMWYHIRIQDTFEKGSLLAVSTAAGDNAGNADLDGDGFHDTPFALRSGQPAEGARALPDGELPDGVPIPAIVPLPGIAMPMMPAKTSVVAVDRGDFGVLSGRRPPNGLGQGPDSSQAVVKINCDPLVTGDCDDAVAGADGVLGNGDDLNPGFPFWLAGNSCGDDGTLCPQGTVGQRMPTPPLDMLTEAGANEIGAFECTAGTIGAACEVDADCDTGPPGPPQPGVCEAVDPLFAGATAAQAGGWDGGLPRHNLRGYTSGGLSLDTQNRLDFRKVVEAAQPVYFPEIGTDLEKVAMADHAVRERDSFANNLADNDITETILVKNGALPVPGAPFQDPCIDDLGFRLGVDPEAGSWYDGDLTPGSYGYVGNTAYEYGSDNPRTYRIANVQIDAVFNKVGWHYPQERIIALWDDVAPTIAKQRPPEPLVMRFNSYDCGRILHTNLVPEEFELDDFQVRTPTDIIGQHIHLPKWDLTTNDGAANGWNYEDGTLSPGIVEERIHAIENFNALAGTSQNLVDILLSLGFTAGDFPPDLLTAIDNHQVNLLDLDPVPTLTVADGADPGSPALDPAVRPGVDLPDDPVAFTGAFAPLHGAEHPFFGAGVGDEYLGARTTIQRILVDPLYNVAGVDRGLGLTFSHDHYGPSTFQQIGLYSTILAQPAGSTWVHNESEEPLYGRPIATTDCTVNCTDGGPTSWQAIIKTPQGSPVPEHREFYFEMSDFQHAYEAGVYVGAGPDGRPVHAPIEQPAFADVTTATAGVNELGFDLQQTWQNAINPPLKLKSVPFPDIVTAEALCPGPAGPNPGAPTNAAANVPRPCAEAINISHSSMFVVNYRNEPVGLRVFDPNTAGPDGQNGTQAAGEAGDLAFALQSRSDRAIPQLNTSFGDMPPGYQTPATYCQGQTGDGINCDRRRGDPITPIMRAYMGDDIKIKIQVGATEEQHQATVHGMKWLSNGSGFGRSPNSGWRNFQSHGISEQFSLQIPLNPDVNQVGQSVDYLYATDATRDGFWTGPWGILRAYGNNQQDLPRLDANPRGNRRIANQNDFAGVCPRVGGQGPGSQDIANLVVYDVTAVLANDVLPNNLGVTIPANINPTDNNGGPLNTAGGTLVYNRRGTQIEECLVAVEEGQACPAGQVVTREGPLNDPTAMMYVHTADLVPADPAAAVCSLDPLVNPNAVDTNADLVPDTVVDPATGGQATSALQLPACPVNLAATAPVEPIALRANAGDCIETILRNRIPTVAPDLAGWQDMMWIVKRNIQVDPVTGLPEMHFFNNNLIRPSSQVGLHAQLVEYDASRDDGVLVGQNAPGQQIVAPGGARTYRWYAGDLTFNKVGVQGNTQLLEIVATPVEFGATNLISADRVKQPQKGMFGALSILPAGSTVTEDTQVADGQADEAVTPLKTRLTRAQVTVDAGPLGAAGDGGTFRENLLVGHKIANLRWKDGTAIANIHQGELGREGAEDSGHAGFNYGMEPSWFRFKLAPDVPFGNAGAVGSFGAIPNQQAMYTNLLTIGEPNAVPAITGVSAAGDPATPVFRADAGQASRIHVLNGASADRDGTFILHGHLWQRDPYVCPGENELGLTGRCLRDGVDENGADLPLTVDSTALGLNPIGKWMGGEEGMGHAYGYWPILFKAGGSGAVDGDYLMRDYSPSGNRNGQFGILRVE